MNKNNAAGAGGTATAAGKRPSLSTKKKVSYDGGDLAAHGEYNRKVGGPKVVFQNLYNDVIHPMYEKQKDRVMWLAQLVVDYSLLSYFVPTYKGKYWAPEKKQAAAKDRRTMAASMMGVKEEERHTEVTEDGDEYEHSALRHVEIETIPRPQIGDPAEAMHWDDHFHGKVVLVANMGMIGDNKCRGGCS